MAARKLLVPALACITPARSVMNPDSSFDRESFQSLLANAYSVQQSGMDPESLAAIIEIQRVVTADDVDAVYAMNLVAERARLVANASGIGVALLDGNHLVHRAGSGAALQHVGSQLAAVLSIAACDHSRREILRVEDARTDSRIEAEICRQFDVQALLMVPIYREHSMIGVLEVLFQEPHVFSEPEIRTYQLMATLAGDASALQPRTRVPVPVGSTVSRALLRMNSQFQSLAQGLNRKAQPAVRSERPAWYRPLFTSLQQFLAMQSSVKENLSRIRLPRWHWPHIAVPSFGWREIILNKRRRPGAASNIQWRNRANLVWNGAAISLVLALAIIAAVARHYSTLPSLAESSHNVVAPASNPAPALPQQPTSAMPVVRAKGAPVHDAGAPSSAFRRVRVRNNEVDYIADDVTVRQFRARPEPKKARAWSKQVNIGQDVTVRYFNSAPATGRPTVTETADQAIKD